ncbi:SGNH/GDSL hydrolase family protein [Dietzia sp. KRD202]|uniref:SGNH/GDSL hydrolase family protein n=1 Tax=Dietzia sp. KRD202 TaxID=2729732 RepID=UPI0019D17DC1|nr:SGNH/GDSL hydrolase family protein [Dietzia sp. KRD202]
MASKRRFATGISGSTLLATVGILIAVVLIAAGLWWDKQRTAIEPSTTGAASSSGLLVEPSTTFAPLETATSKLADPSQPVRILVIGDSTGNDTDEWVSFTARHLAEDKGRAVAMTTWNADNEEFGREVQFPGAGELVTITNFSAPGVAPPYHYYRLDAIADDRPDLVVISHGHNSPAVESHLKALTAKVGELWPDPPALAVIDQNPRTDDPAQSQIAAGEMDKFAAAHPSVTVIDVRSAFENGGGGSLLSDGLHPNVEGSRLWARTVWSALGIS